MRWASSATWASRADPRPRSRSKIYSFRFPPQDHKIEVGDRPRDQHGNSIGEVVSVDDRDGVIDLKVGVQPGSTGADITDRLRVCRSRAKTAEPSESGDVGD